MGENHMTSHFSPSLLPPSIPLTNAEGINITWIQLRDVEAIVGVIDIQELDIHHSYAIGHLKDTTANSILRHFLTTS